MYELISFFFIFTLLFILMSEYVGYKIFGDFFSQTYKNYLFTTSRIFGAFYRGSIDDDTVLTERMYYQTQISNSTSLET